MQFLKWECGWLKRKRHSRCLGKRGVGYLGGGFERKRINEVKNRISLAAKLNTVVGDGEGQRGRGSIGGINLHDGHRWGKT